MSALDILSSNCPHFIYYSDEIENFLMKELNATSRLFHNPGNYNEGNCEKPTPLIFQVYYRDQVMMMGWKLNEVFLNISSFPRAYD